MQLELVDNTPEKPVASEVVKSPAVPTGVSAIRRNEAGSTLGKKKWNGEIASRKIGDDQGTPKESGKRSGNPNFSQDQAVPEDDRDAQPFSRFT